MGEIQSSIEDLEDADSLDRVLTLLVQANAAIQSSTPPNTQSFERKDKFKARQRNETQLSFRRTTKNPGRKKATTTMKWVTSTYLFQQVIMLAINQQTTKATTGGYMVKHGGSIQITVCTI